MSQIPSNPANLAFSPVFQDFAVLQRDLPIPVWGTAHPEERVVITLAGHSMEANSDRAGVWFVRFRPLPAGGPHVLAAESRGTLISVRNILIGEVWLCSGQSNMELPLGLTSQAAAPRSEKTAGSIRLLAVETPAGFGQNHTLTGRWKIATQEALAQFSAVAGWFGDALRSHLDIPVGLICNAWGGTAIQTWMSRRALMLEPETANEVREFEAGLYSNTPQEFVDFADWERRGAPQDTANLGVERGWELPDFCDESWGEMQLPSPWQDRGHPGNGVFWFRKTVTIPISWTGKDLDLGLGAIDKHDETWVNGTRIGGLSWESGPQTFLKRRNYKIPAGLVPGSGRLCIAVRARSHVFQGGLTGPGKAMRLVPWGEDSGGISLAGDWRYEIEQDWGKVAPFAGQSMINSPAIMYNCRLSPLIPYGIRGVLWYQGESNTGNARLYRTLLQKLIRDWREAWQQGDFPFLLVQLASYLEAKDQPDKSEWAQLREAQLAALREPETGLAVSIDVGEPTDIHPQDKKTVGNRLAAWALNSVYGKPVTRSGPLYRRVEFGAEGIARIFFTDGRGLRTKDGQPPRQVAVAGKDRRFIWAETRIEGETLLVWSPEIPLPTAIRYAWADNPEGCNLENESGLPASPFRTDDWPD